MLRVCRDIGSILSSDINLPNHHQLICRNGEPTAIRRTSRGTNALSIPAHEGCSPTGNSCAMVEKSRSGSIVSCGETTPPPLSPKIWRVRPSPAGSSRASFDTPSRPMHLLFHTDRRLATKLRSFVELVHARTWTRESQRFTDRRFRISPLIKATGSNRPSAADQHRRNSAKSCHSLKAMMQSPAQLISC